MKFSGIRKRILTEVFLINKKAIDLPLVYLDDAYMLGYGDLFAYFYDKEYGIAGEGLDAPGVVGYNKTFAREQLDQLLDSLDIRKINLRKRMKMWTWDGEDEEILEQKRFLAVYGEKRLKGDFSLVITEDGEIYVNGYCYTGDSSKFQKVFLEFAEGLMADEENGATQTDEQYRKELQQRIEKINWD